MSEFNLNEDLFVEQPSRLELGVERLIRPFVRPLLEFTHVQQHEEDRIIDLTDRAMLPDKDVVDYRAIGRSAFFQDISSIS